MQLYTDIYLLLNYSTCFGRPSRPSSGVHTTVVAASCTTVCVCGRVSVATLLKIRNHGFEVGSDVTVLAEIQRKIPMSESSGTVRCVDW